MASEAAARPDGSDEDAVIVGMSSASESIFESIATMWLAIDGVLRKRSWSSMAVRYPMRAMWRAPIAGFVFGGPRSSR